MNKEGEETDGAYRQVSVSVEDRRVQDLEFSLPALPPLTPYIHSV